MQLEIDPIDDDLAQVCKAKYGCEIKFKASMVWIGKTQTLIKCQ